MPARRRQFVLHAKTLPGNPYDGHTLGVVIEDTERLTGCADRAGPMRQGISWAPRGQSARVLSLAKSAASRRHQARLRRRCAIEAVIGHMRDRRSPRPLPSQGPPRRCRNVILTASATTFRLVLAWLRALCRLIVSRSCRLSQPGQPLNRLLNGRLVTFRDGDQTR